MCGWTSGCGRKGSVKDDARVLPGLRAPICGDGKTGAGLVLPERSSGRLWEAVEGGGRRYGSPSRSSFTICGARAQWKVLRRRNEMPRKELR